MSKKSEAQFVIQKIQPGLLGLMDGSVSTLAPIFATAGLTGQPIKAFYVGLAASLGAGISMGLAEALSDDGKVTGRGSPIIRGAITAFATALGGMLHTLPFLIPNLHRAICNSFYTLQIHENPFVLHLIAGYCGRRNSFCRWLMAGQCRILKIYTRNISNL